MELFMEESDTTLMPLVHSFSDMNPLVNLSGPERVSEPHPSSEERLGESIGAGGGGGGGNMSTRCNDAE